MRPGKVSEARLKRDLSSLRTPVKSTVIASVGYDPDSNTMDVEFRTGRLYRYFLITPQVHTALMNAESIGRYFNAEIRDRFPCREIVDDTTTR